VTDPVGLGTGVGSDAIGLGDATGVAADPVGLGTGVGSRLLVGTAEQDGEALVTCRCADCRCWPA
jgi:hypothetical protein